METDPSITQVDSNESPSINTAIAKETVISSGVDGESDRLTEFFIALWEDILSYSTLDSYRVRTCSVQSLLKELAYLARVGQRDKRAGRQVPFIIEEMIDAAGRDPVLSDLFPSAIEQVKGLKTHANSLPRLEISANVVHGQLNKYRNRLIKEIREILDQGDEKPKEKLATLTSCLATEYTTRGFSLAYLRSLSSILRDESTPKLADRFDKLIKKLRGNSHKYDCYLPMDKQLPVLCRNPLESGVKQP